MKNYLHLNLFFLLLSTFIFPQEVDNWETYRTLTFYDSCEKSYFEKSPDKLNNIIIINIERKNWNAHYIFSEKEIKNDTVFLPKFLFAVKGSMHNQEWSYLNCHEIAEGNLIDFYPNKLKRVEGEFVNGKPNYLIEYNENGLKTVEEFYKPGTQDYIRKNYFDEQGFLSTYEIHKNKKRKTIIETYNLNGELINKQINLKYIKK